MGTTIPKTELGTTIFFSVWVVLNSYFREIRVQSYRLRGQSDKKMFSSSRFEEYELGINVEIRLMFCSLSVFNIQVKVKNDIWFTRPGTYPVLPSLFQHWFITNSPCWFSSRSSVLLFVQLGLRYDNKLEPNLLNNTMVKTLPYQFT